MIALVCALWLAPGCPAAPVEPNGVVTVAAALNTQAALGEINAYRRSHGLKLVVLDARLSRAATVQAQTQAKRGAIGHQGADGSKPVQRMARAGYDAHLAAENVASGQKNFGEVLRAWERSPEHNRNLLLPDAEAVGLGVSYRAGRAYWTLVLGAGG